MIECSKYVFYVCMGLIISGDDRYDHSDAELVKLADQINAMNFPDFIKAWFVQARTGQIDVNPYWPRGSALAIACFFIDDNYYFDQEAFTCFIECTESFFGSKRGY